MYGKFLGNINEIFEYHEQHLTYLIIIVEIKPFISEFCDNDHNDFAQNLKVLIEHQS